MDAVNLRELITLLNQHRQPPAAAGQPIVLVDLDDLESLSPDDANLLARRLPDDLRSYVGVRSSPLPALLIGPGQEVLEGLTCTICPRPEDGSHLEVPEGRASAVSTVVRVSDPAGAARGILDQALRTPEAVHVLDTTLRIAERATARETLIIESHGYTSLLDGPEYRQLRQDTATPTTGPPSQIVRDRTDERCVVTIDWTTGESGMDHQLRGALAQALFDARDEGCSEISLRATGPDFCAQAIPDDDTSSRRARDASLKRLRLHPGIAAWVVHRRLSVAVQGRCSSAGLELMAFATSATAAPGSTFSIPHVRLGLVFGAGGSVSVTRRIGRWRTAYLALTGQEITAETALRWGLIDAIEGPSTARPASSSGPASRAVPTPVPGR